MRTENTFGSMLRGLRTKWNWTQTATAKKLGVSLRLYGAWERGERLPTSQDVKHMAVLFGLVDEEEQAFYQAAAQTIQYTENFPFKQNPFFTGREAQLHKIHQLLTEGDAAKTTQPVIICGMGGIGKTQLALEYAHRHYKHTYQVVLWVDATERITIERSYHELANVLELPIEAEADTTQVIQAVKQWLAKYTKWLLIMDNADDVRLARSFLPTQSEGHVLLTTCSAIVGKANIAKKIPLEEMEQEESVLFLMRRSGTEQCESEQTAARLLGKLLGYHPLALDQAAAYIEQAGTTCAKYIELYQQARLAFLDKRGLWEEGDEPPEPIEHPASVVVTVRLNFTKACERHPLVQDLLYFCSFLQPEAIPEELLYQDEGLKLDSVLLDEAMRAMRRYSLVKRNAQNETLSMHRLIQEVLVDTLPAKQQGEWMERVVRALHASLPPIRDSSTWEQWERLIPHALSCMIWPEPYITLPLVVADILQIAGLYLQARGRAEDAYQPVLVAYYLHEKYLGADHLLTLRVLHSLAIIYMSKQNYEAAEWHLRRISSIYSERLGLYHEDTINCLHDLATVHIDLRKFEDIEPFLLSMLDREKEQFGEGHLETVRWINLLAYLYLEQHRREEAKILYTQALEILEAHAESNISEYIFTLYWLGKTFVDEKQYLQARPIYERCLYWMKQKFGVDHPGIEKITEVISMLNEMVDELPPS